MAYSTAQTGNFLDANGRPLLGPSVRAADPAAAFQTTPRTQASAPTLPSGSGYYNPALSSSAQVSGGRTPAQMSTLNQSGVSSSLLGSGRPASVGGGASGPLQNPGNNMVNPGYDEQALLYAQNRLLNDPSAGMLQQQYQNLQNPTQGEQFMNQNLGTLMGPGQGDQYWNQVQGQYMNPMAGEQFARQATQNFGAQGPASAFYDQAMGQYGQFTGYTGPQNTQGQYGATSAELAGGSAGERGLGQIAGGYAQNGTYNGANNALGQYGQSAASMAGGTQGEQGLGQLAGMYGQLGQYQGGNNALGQYQQNAASGPLAAQSFYDQVAGSYGSMGQYSDPNLAAGQYAQTQQAFGDLPIANFDPFYDRARQLGVQDYNRQAAGRGVYGSSEALSGVGNVITDIEAQRANRSFDAEMQRAQEQRARQELLGNQARMGDLSSLAAFGANLSGLETFGGLANQAGNQTLAQQTMLGNQARASDQTALDAFNSNLAGVNTFAGVNQAMGGLEIDRNRALADMARNADISGTDAFRANLEGASTYANINDQLANQALKRNELLGNLASSADSAALGAQNANIAGLNAFGNIASSADSAETNRYNATTSAMNAADRTALDRMNSGADIAFKGDENKRANYQTSMGAARDVANLGMNRNEQAANIANTLGGNDLARINSFMSAAGQAEGSRQGRMNSTINAISGYSKQVQSAISDALEGAISGNQSDWESAWQAGLLPTLQKANLDQKQIDQIYELFKGVAEAKAKGG